MPKQIQMQFLTTAIGTLYLFGGVAIAEPADWIQYESGDVPIILVTGHGGDKTPKEWRVRTNPGVLNAKDSYTWPLSKQLWERMKTDHGLSPYWVLNTVHRKYADVNRAPGEKAYESPEGRAVYEAFHEALERAVEDSVERFEFAFIVDIHGQSKQPADVYLGTGRRKSMDDLLRRFGEDVLMGRHSLQEELVARGYSSPRNIRPPGPYEIPGSVSGGYITRHYGSRVLVDAVQIEVHGRRRKDETLLPIVAKDLSDALAQFHKVYLAEAVSP